MVRSLVLSVGMEYEVHTGTLVGDGYTLRVCEIW